MNAKGASAENARAVRRVTLGPGAAWAALAVALAMPARDAEACAAAWQRAEPPVHVVREEALVVWDEASGVEHFVRSAVFDASVKSFGFIVPTPSRPTLAEASDDAFAALRQLTAAPVETVTRWDLVPIGCTSTPFLFTRGGAPSAPAGAPHVTVIAEARVAGMDATILEATDGSALSTWLGDHGFEAREALRDWASGYVAKRWVFTAFRYVRPDVASRGGGAAGVGARAVRLTFRTPEPVYPYREPADTAAVTNRELHLFVVAPKRTAGALSDLDAGTWTAPTLFAGALPPSEALWRTLPGVTPPAGAWLTEIVDHTAKRPPSDVAFRDATGGEVKRPPIVRELRRGVPVPYEVPLVVAAAWWWRRRKKRATSSRAGD